MPFPATSRPCDSLTLIVHVLILVQTRLLYNFDVNKLSFSQTLSSPLSPQLFLEQPRTLRCLLAKHGYINESRVAPQVSTLLWAIGAIRYSVRRSLYISSSHLLSLLLSSPSPFLRCDLHPQTNYAFLHCVWAGVGRWRDNLRRAKDKLDQSRLLCPGCGHSIAILSISVVSARTQSPPPSAFSCTRGESTALVERVLESRNAPRLHDCLCSC